MAFLSREEAATRVGKSEKTIRRWEQGGLRVMLGLIREDDLLEFDRAQRSKQGRPSKSVLKRFVAGDYAKVFDALTAEDRTRLAEELVELAEFVAAASARRAA